MANQIKIKRGLKGGIPALASGEPGWCTDTFELYVGDGATNRFIGSPDVLLKAGGTMSGFLVLHADPDSAMKAVTKQYADALVSGLHPKAAVRLTTTAALPACTAAGSGVGKTLTMDAVGVLTIDSVDTVLNDRILVKNQANAVDNGIYKVTTEGTASVAAVLTRATDCDQDAEVKSGLYTFTEEGTAHDNAGFVLSTNNPITVDTTALAFTQFSGAGQITAGAGLTKTGDTLDVGAGDGIQADADAVTVKLDGATLSKGASGLKIAAGGVGVNEIAAAIAGAGLSGGSGSALSVVYGYTAETALAGNATLDGGTW